MLGTWGGDNQVDRDFPRYQSWLAADAWPAELLLSPPRPLREVNEAMTDLETGRAARPMIDMSLE